ncbi:PepSY domain-containing protein [Acinetobacter ursingii]|uniref:PepSY-associated TM helix domain-containing protein n=1 Tax=Acinetobacter ursingii TaxID=108980 RepID=UPI00125078F3|nr:PepSY-associated TM helix domain-containing protein [Acinetobacter ursingii]MCU4304971.1 PepSY domain-containing protein [Acinetobacter ursingii]MCU4370976.1 PepSY domain-containing protein [Acinetobacter ursingii]MDG9991574.1 PepSY domain-containing protein [Acinetobacter ursingii]MDH0204814.1 PepSY domain-containing protein [Acinetobacter ursingii]
MRVDGKAEGPRQSMSWLHTWSSLILGWLLYAIFLTGTLSFFQSEMTVWMKPELHQSLPPQSQVQQVQTALSFLQHKAPDAGAWNINLPSSRQTTTELNVRGANEDPRARRGGERITIDSSTGEEIKARETRGGGFLYRFHFELYGMPRIWARWIVGIATLMMFVAIISGVITHKKIFKDFFTFRAGKGQRSWLDAHNATAVLALPFHIMITFSGLLLLMYMLMPWGISSVYPDRIQFLQAQRAEMLGEKPPENQEGSGREGRGEQSQNQGNRNMVAGQDRSQSMSRGEGSASQSGQQRGERRNGAPRDGARERRDLPTQTAALTDITPLMLYAQKQWPDNTVGTISIIRPNTTNSEIEIKALYAESVLHRNVAPTLIFNGVTGELVSDAKPVYISVPTGIYNAVTVLHEGRGLDLGLRWLLFISGVVGTLMVATGLILWCVKRAPQQEKQGFKSFGFRLVENLNIAAIIGLPIAIASYFYANRLIPAQLENRSDLEIKTFFWIWLFTLIYAALRPARQAWLELLTLAALMYLCIPVLNALTGGRALWSSIYHEQWMVASFDLVCLFLAILFIFSFFKLKKHKGTVKVKKHIQPKQALAEAVEEA